MVTIAVVAAPESYHVSRTIITIRREDNRNHQSYKEMKRLYVEAGEDLRSAFDRHLVVPSYVNQPRNLDFGQGLLQVD